MSDLTVGKIEFTARDRYNAERSLRKLTNKLNKRNDAIKEVEKLVNKYGLDITKLEIDSLVDKIILIMQEERL